MNKDSKERCVALNYISSPPCSYFIGLASIWRDSLVFPAYISAASGVVLVLHIILHSQTFKRLYAHFIPKSRAADPDLSAREILQGVHPASSFGQMREHVEHHGGIAIFAHMLTRFVGCATLLGVSVATFIFEETGQVEDIIFSMAGKHWGRKHKHCNHKHPGGHGDVFSEAEWLQVALCIATVCGFINKGYLREINELYTADLHVLPRIGICSHSTPVESPNQQSSGSHSPRSLRRVLIP